MAPERLGDASARHERSPTFITVVRRTRTTVSQPKGPYLRETSRELTLTHHISSHLSTSSMVETSRKLDDITLEEDEDNPDYMNESVFERNRLPPRAYFLPAEHLSLSGKWRFHYASSPLDPEPQPADDDAWDLIHVPGKLIFRAASYPYISHFYG